MLHHRIIGTGTPVVILHGVALDHRYMVDTMEPAFLTSGPWQRIYVDMPGHGKSPAQDSIRAQDDLLDAVVAFIDALLPDQQFAIVGLSRGSYIARGVIYRRPARVIGAALIAAGGNPASDPARLPPHRVLEPDPEIAPTLTEAELWAHENISVIQRWDIVEKRRAVIAPARALFDAQQDARVQTAFDFSFAAHEEVMVFDRPSLIVAGRQDHLAGYLDSMDLARRYTRATLAVLDTAGHALAWERPEVFHALVRDWLARLPNR